MKVFDRFWGSRSILSSIFAALVVLLLVSSIAEPSYGAAALVVRNGFIDNVKVIGYGDITGTPTFATTSYADVAGSNVTYVPTLNDCTTAARLGACLIEVSWNLDVTKATATSGICGVFVNGALVASSGRTATFAGGEDTIGGVFMFANTTVGSQTLKLQCKSADTNILTVNFGHVVFKEVIPPFAR